MDPTLQLQLDSAGDLDLAGLELRARRAHGNDSLPLREWIALAEAWRIAQALSEARGNRSAAARALGIGRRTLYSKIEKLGLVPSWSATRSAASANGAAVLANGPPPRAR
jgi:DNA-binding NtrC family response regulator